MIAASGFKYVGMEIVLILHFKDCILIVLYAEESQYLQTHLQKKIKPAEISFPEKQF